MVFQISPVLNNKKLLNNIKQYITLCVCCKMAGRAIFLLLRIGRVRILLYQYTNGIYKCVIVYFTSLPV